MSVQPRTYPVVYGGWVGVIIAILVIVACLVLWLTNQIEPKLALLIAATAVTRLL